MNLAGPCRVLQQGATNGDKIKLVPSEALFQIIQ